MRAHAFWILLAVLSVSSLFSQELTVAICPFEARGGVSMEEADAITELVTAELVLDKAVKVVDRNSLDRILTEMKFQVSDWSDSNKIAQLGMALNANALLRGTVMSLGANKIVTATILDINTMQILSSSRLQLKNIDEFFEKVPAFIDEIMKNMRPGVYRVSSAEEFKDAVSAINADNSGIGTITIIGNFAITGVSVGDKAGIAITLQGDETRRTISSSGASPMFSVSSGVTLRIGNNLTLHGRNNKATAVEISSNGTLELYAGSIITAFSYSGVRNEGGTLNIYGGTIENNFQSGVYQNYGIFTMYGGSISNNSYFENDQSGGVRIYDGNFLKIGGSIFGNKTPQVRVHRYSGHDLCRKTDAGPDIRLDSKIPDLSGGWD